ncbi:MAG: phospho-N-acetylmuramoyl-pentapeptide-transferase [Clostridiales bacterium]|nr:phospho-N-acetylmuramoyl-pentapeptide-transferase [Clostridiales bacterium]
MADKTWVSILCVIAVAFVVSAVLTRILIPYLRKWAGQNIREDGPQAHLSKQGTPSMGGIAIVAAILAGSAFGGFFGHAMIIMDIGMLIFAAVGFLDDYLKIIKKENEGLKVKPKFAFQFIGALAIAVYIAYVSGFGTDMYIPFFKVTVDLGIWYVPFIVFTILAMVNAVNLTDGLDGLASGTTAVVSFFLMLVAVKAGAAGSTGFCAAILGACLGFLVWNHHPAKVFMGDTGSLALGGAVTMAAVAMGMELFLPLMGLIYVAEALSVIIQVVYFKKTGGKRFFRMAPLHHHFELGGMKETKVALMFWALTLLFCLIGYFAGI